MYLFVIIMKTKLKITVHLSYILGFNLQFVKLMQSSQKVQEDVRVWSMNINQYTIYNPHILQLFAKMDIVCIG